MRAVFIECIRIGSEDLCIREEFTKLLGYPLCAASEKSEFPSAIGASGVQFPRIAAVVADKPVVVRVVGQRYAAAGAFVYESAIGAGHELV